MLILEGSIEILENHQKHEKVVHAQGFFDHVAGKKFQGYLRAPDEIDAEIEDHRQAHPNEAPNGRFFDGHSVSFAVKNPQIEGEHAEDKYVEANPEKHPFRIHEPYSCKKPKKTVWCAAAKLASAREKNQRKELLNAEDLKKRSSYVRG